MNLDHGSTITQAPPGYSISGVISVIFGAVASIIGIVAFGLSFSREADGTLTHPLTPGLMIIFLYLPAVLIAFLTAIGSTISRKRQRDLLIVAWVLIAAQIAFWAVLISLDRSILSFRPPLGSLGIL